MKQVEAQSGQRGTMFQGWLAPLAMVVRVFIMTADVIVAGPWIL